MDAYKKAEDIILGQYSKYPKLKIKDIIKALYQSEFGCAHFVANEKSAEKYLADELKSIENMTSDSSFIEQIGRSFSRVHLRGLKESGLSPRTLLKLFIITSAQRKVSSKDFIAKLDCLIRMCEGNQLPFTWSEAYEIVNSYQKDGIKAVHHSEEFKKIYSPAYRVIKSDLCRYIPLFSEIDRLSREKDTVTIAIDGKCTSGKTTLSNHLDEIYDCNVFRMDSFFLQKHQRTEERLAEPGGNVDYERFKAEVLGNIHRSGGFSYRPYDCGKQVLAQPVSVDHKKLNIVEGVYSLHPSLVSAYDLKVFIDIDYEEQLRRLGERNSTQMRERFINEWIPLEEMYFEKMKIRDKCDLIFYATG